MRSIKILILVLFAGTFMASAQDAQSLYLIANLEGTIETIEPEVRKALKSEKFGVITEIDMSKTLKEKIDADIMPYKILGVCHPGFAHEAIQAEENIGVFLPCKVILKQVEANRVEVVSVDPAQMMKMIGNPELDKTAGEVSQRLKKVMEKVADL